MNATKSTPDQLFRLTSDEQYSLDSEGFLLSHRPAIDPDNRDGPIGKIRSVPLVHPNEWTIIARFLYFGYYLDQFRLLKIDRSKINLLRIGNHPGLENGEFFAVVHSNAILSDERYTWVNDGSDLDEPSKRFSNQVPSLSHMICRSRGYSPIRLR